MLWELQINIINTLTRSERSFNDIFFKEKTMSLLYFTFFLRNFTSEVKSKIFKKINANFM